MDDALGLVDDVALAGFFHDLIRTHREGRQVDFTVPVCGELLGAEAPVHGADDKDRVGNYLGRVGGVHLHQPHAGLLVVQENQLFDTAASGQLHLLGRGDDVGGIAGVYLDHSVGPRLEVGQQNFSHGVGFIAAQRYCILENLKGYSAHGGMGLGIIFGDFQAGQSVIFQGIADTLAGNDGGSVGLRVPLPALQGGQLYDFISAWKEFCECIRAACTGLPSIGGS